ncbi:MAG: hypothetical protein EOP87_24830 [Verrucomicrobiaceae bacterium]|nr:MAG: hypothetical protein EOP87_24830 [Verrucomicrobiaceae bacterium]
MIDACHAVLETEARSGRGALDEKSTVIFHIYRFLCEYENGGLGGFLYNISPEWDDVAALGGIASDLGRAELAQALERVHAIMKRGHDGDSGTWEEWLEATDPEYELEELDEEISDSFGMLWDELGELILPGE